jgi:hypothetical protein
MLVIGSLLMELQAQNGTDMEGDKGPNWALWTRAQGRVLGQFMLECGCHQGTRVP